MLDVREMKHDGHGKPKQITIWKQRETNYERGCVYLQKDCREYAPEGCERQAPHPDPHRPAVEEHPHSVSVRLRCVEVSADKRCDERRQDPPEEAGEAHLHAALVSC